MINDDFARYAEAIAVAARKDVQVEIMWQKHLEEELRRKELAGKMERNPPGKFA